jgi:putative transposase
MLVYPYLQGITLNCAVLTAECKFNSDQGARFTSRAFTSALEEASVRVSMDGRGRALDNVFIERLWRSVKHEDIYLKDYGTGHELIVGLSLTERND